MPRKKNSEAADTACPRWLPQALVLVLMVGAFLAGLIFLGQWGLEQLRGRERYLVPFADIECSPPPGMDRREFLDEVQYHARLPDRIGLLDEDLPRKLSDAFSRHPWVEKVQAVSLKPPRHIEMTLSYRRPVLAVRAGDSVIAVDGFGVRLPKNAPTAGLPVYEGAAAPPKGPAGSKWGDPGVEERARHLASGER